MSEYLDKFKSKAKVYHNCNGNCPFEIDTVLCAGPLMLSDERILSVSHVCTHSLRGFKR